MDALAQKCLDNEAERHRIACLDRAAKARERAAKQGRHPQAKPMSQAQRRAEYLAEKSA